MTQLEGLTPDVIRPTKYGNSRCPKCIGGQLAWDVEMYCLQCGWRSTYRPLTDRVYATDQFYKRGSHAPATRVYE